MRKFNIIAGIVLLFLSSCYKLEEEVYTDVAKPDGKIGVFLSEAEDTIYVYDVTPMYYSLMLRTETLAEAEVMIDGDHIYTKSSGNTITFEVDPKDFETGYYRMEIKLLLQTGSGSLADKADAEFLEVTDSKIIYIDLAPPSFKLEAKFVIEDGRSLIRWNKPDKDNFLHFYIFRNNRGDSIVVAKDSLELLESRYAGGPASYRVGIRGYNFHQETEIDVNENLIEDFEWSLLESNGIQISTPNFRLYNNNLKLQIKNINNYRGLSEYVDKVDQSTSLIENIPLYFGEVRKFSIQLGPVFNSHAYEDTLEVFLGTRIKEFYASHHIKEKNIMMLVTKVTVKNKPGHTIIYKYSFPQMILQDSLKVDIDLNKDAKILFSQNGEYNYIIDYGDRAIKKLDIENMAVSYHSNIPEFFPAFDYYSSPISSISNNNLLCLSEYFTRYVVDLSTNQIVFEHTDDLHPLFRSNFVKLSPDGKFLLLFEGRYDKAIYEWNGSGFTRKGYLWWTIKASCHFFVEDGVNKLIAVYANPVYDDNGYATFNLDEEPDEDGYLKGIEKSPETLVKNGRFDYITNSIYGYSIDPEEQGLFVYDINDWSVTYKKMVFSSEIRYYDGTLLSPAGSMLKE